MAVPIVNFDFIWDLSMCRLGEEEEEVGDHLLELAVRILSFLMVLRWNFFNLMAS